MIESKIVNLLQKHTTKVVASKFPVKYLGMNMPVKDKFWEIVYIPNNIDNEFWDKGKTYRGILRLILHWPQDNKGAYKPLEEAERVAKGFAKGLQLYDIDENIRVSITDNPDLTGFVENDGKILLPLTINYLCYTV